MAKLCPHPPPKPLPPAKFWGGPYGGQVRAVDRTKVKNLTLTVQDELGFLHDYRIVVASSGQVFHSDFQYVEGSMRMEVKQKRKSFFAHIKKYFSKSIK